MATPTQIPDVILHLANKLLEYLKSSRPWLKTAETGLYIIITALLNRLQVFDGVMSLALSP